MDYYKALGVKTLLPPCAVFMESAAPYVEATRPLKIMFLMRRDIRQMNPGSRSSHALSPGRFT